MPSLQTGEVHISAVPGANRGEDAAYMDLSRL